MAERPLFEDTPVPSPITEFVCQVTSNINGAAEHYASGTAVIISPFLAFSARHVLDEHWMRHEGRPMSAGENAGSFSFTLVQLVERRLNLWTVTRLWTSELTDIVVLRLTAISVGAQAYAFRRLRLDLMPPAVGERITAFGYHNNEVEVREENEIIFRQAAATTHGDVLEVHHQFRDTARLRFPCFRTNARFDGGMSGGPVFNEKGRLCGMICSSLPPTADDEEYASYVVSLWPAMAIVIDADRPGHPAGARYPLFDLVRNNVIVAMNADRLTVGEVPETGTPRISFTLP